MATSSKRAYPSAAFRYIQYNDMPITTLPLGTSNWKSFKAATDGRESSSSPSISLSKAPWWLEALIIQEIGLNMKFVSLENTPASPLLVFLRLPERRLTRESIGICMRFNCECCIRAILHSFIRLCVFLRACRVSWCRGFVVLYRQRAHPNRLRRFHG